MYTYVRVFRGGVITDHSQRIETGLSRIEQFFLTSDDFTISDDQIIQQYADEDDQYIKTNNFETPSEITRISRKNMPVLNGSSAQLYDDLSSPNLTLGSKDAAPPQLIGQGDDSILSAQYAPVSTAFIWNDRRKVVELGHMSHTENEARKGVTPLEPGKIHDGASRIGVNHKSLFRLHSVT